MAKSNSPRPAVKLVLRAWCKKCGQRLEAKPRRGKTGYWLACMKCERIATAEEAQDREPIGADQ